MTQQNPNLRFLTAQEVFQAMPQIEEDLTARPNGHEAIGFIEALAKSQTPEEALTFSAYALEPRHAVWWGHECLRHADAGLGDADRQMMDLAAHWVGAPDEDHRYAALDAAMNSSAKTPGVWIAFAAGWSSGSMAPKGAPAVPVAPHFTARAVNAGVLSALARVERTQRTAMLQTYVKMALMLAGSD
ncbi:MAG: hypothetical protein GC186_13290 [Rhodobacteraceae bacterium]|nr:hypothetical protein [Paracoccaceae bacterium]